MVPMIEGLNNPRDERGKHAGWACVGFVEEGRGSKRTEVSVPIGVYTLYQQAMMAGYAWKKAANDSARFEIERLYEDCDE